MKYLIILGLFSAAGASSWLYLNGPSPRLTFGDRGRENPVPPDDWTVAKFSPDGKYILASASKDRGVAKLWDAETGKEIRSFSVPMTDFRCGIRDVGFSRDGKYVYAVAPNLFAWDRDTGKELFASNASGWAFGVSPVESKIVVGAAAGFSVVDASDGKVIKLVKDGPEFLNQPARKIHISPDGKWFVFITGSEMSIWDLAKIEMIILGHANPAGREPKKQFRFPDGYSALGFAISPDGKGLMIPIFRGGEIVEVDFATGKEKKRYQLGGDDIRVNVLCFSPKGDKVITSNANNGDTRIYSFPECKELKRISGYGNVQFSPDGKTALTFTKDGRMMLWDLE
jgi:Tol biopolymer transport system component